MKRMIKTEKSLQIHIIWDNICLKFDNNDIFVFYEVLK